MTWWVSNTFEQERLRKTVDGAIANGASFPLEVEFVRHKKMSKAGNEYNALVLQIVNTEMPWKFHLSLKTNLRLLKPKTLSESITSLCQPLYVASVVLNDTPTVQPSA